MFSFSEQIFIKHAPLFYQFFNHMKDLIFLMKVEQDGNSYHFRYELMNEAAFHYSGMSEDAYGRTVVDIYPNEMGQLLQEHLVRAVETGQPVTFEDKVEAMNFYGETIINPIFDEHGNCTHVFSLVRDITKRKTIERELELNRQRYESLFFHHPDAVYSFDLEGKILSANEGLEKVSGYSVEELLGQSFLPYVQPECIGETITHFYKSTQGEPQAYESAIIHKEGHRTVISVQNIPIVAEGEIVGVYGIAKDITKEKERQAILHEVKEQLEAFWLNTTEAIFMLDTKGHILKVNKAFEDLFGEDYQFSLEPEFIDDDRLQIGSRILRGESVINHEEKRSTQDGRFLDILASYTPIFDSKGTVIGATAFYRDITDRKLAEEELKQSEEKYRLIAENMTDLIAIVDSDLNVFYASPSYVTVLGVDPNVYAENRAGHMIDEAYRSVFVEKYQQLMKSKKPVAFEAQLKQKNPEGLPLYLETFANPILDGQGNIEKILCVSRDISRRKHVEEALRESEERFRLITENTLDVIKLLDSNGIHTYASPSHETVLGYKPSDYLGKTVFMDTHPEDLIKIQRAFVRLTLSKEADTVEIRKRTADGDWIWMDASMTPVLSKEGDLKNVVVVSRDVTDRMGREKLMQYLAYHDSLTGLPNRRLFMERLEQLNTLKNKKPFAVLVLDCDHFKQINDTMGHDIGDQVIKEFAARLQSCIRESDIVPASTVSRLGGDEFIVLLQDLREEAHAVNIAERILETMREPWSFEGTTLLLTTSIGIAFYSEADCLESKVIIKNADTALYQAKEAGRNTYTVFGEDS